MTLQSARARWPMGVAMLAGIALSTSLAAQDLYDLNTLRTFNLTFTEADWLTRLKNNYASETNLAATLVVDGVTYPNVGVRLRGNTSYSTVLNAGSEKFSFKIDMDFVNPTQELYGYNNINLNNGFRDPTFSREVVYNNFVARFIPNSRANNALLVINGQNWGVYNNIQQTDKSLLRRYFSNADGMRVKCANNPNGPGLRFNGTAASGYTAYEIQETGGLADPLQALINVTNTLSNAPLTDVPAIDSVFAIDPSIWSVVLENILSDDDSYVNKGCDFMTYRDPLDGRTHLIQRDANETFTITSWQPTFRFDLTPNRPFLNRILSVPELRQRFMAHYRTVKRDLSWAYFEPLFNQRKAQLDAAVNADPKKLYTYAQFNANFTTNQTLAFPGLGGGAIIGLQPFVEQRASFLSSNTALITELNAVGPNITSVAQSAAFPSVTTPLFITAAVQPNGNPITRVELFYRPLRSGVYQRVTMLDNGQVGDGAAGDGVFGVALPVTPTPGLIVPYYVMATATNAYGSLTFLPALAERAPRQVEYTFGNTGGMRITEWMYSGLSGEFIELTNRSDAPIDLSGWSIDDDRATPGGFSLSAVGTVAPNETVVITEADAEVFRAAWSLPASAKIIGGLGVVAGSNSLGRNDQIHVYNASGQLVDRLFYGDQNIIGSIRTQNRSGQSPCSAIGENNVLAWQLSTVGDAYGSVAASSGDVGTPGRFPGLGCAATDLVFRNGFE
jgi:hypothetical protein